MLHQKKLGNGIKNERRGRVDSARNISYISKDAVMPTGILLFMSILWKQNDTSSIMKEN